MAGHVVGEFALAELAARKRVAQLGPAGLQIAALRPVGRVGVGAQQAVAKARQQAVRGAGGRDVKVDDVQFGFAQGQAPGVVAVLGGLHGGGEFVHVGFHHLAGLRAAPGADAAALAVQHAQLLEALQVGQGARDDAAFGRALGLGVKGDAVARGLGAEFFIHRPVRVAGQVQAALGVSAGGGRAVDFFDGLARLGLAGRAAAAQGDPSQQELALRLAVEDFQLALPVFPAAFGAGGAPARLLAGPAAGFAHEDDLPDFGPQRPAQGVGKGALHGGVAGPVGRLAGAGAGAHAHGVVAALQVAVGRFAVPAGQAQVVAPAEFKAVRLAVPAAAGPALAAEAKARGGVERAIERDVDAGALQHARVGQRAQLLEAAARGGGAIRQGRAAVASGAGRAGLPGLGLGLRAGGFVNEVFMPGHAARAGGAAIGPGFVIQRQADRPQAGIQRLRPEGRGLAGLLGQRLAHGVVKAGRSGQPGQRHPPQQGREGQPGVQPQQQARAPGRRGGGGSGQAVFDFHEGIGGLHERALPREPGHVPQATAQLVESLAGGQHGVRQPHDAALVFHAQPLVARAAQQVDGADPGVRHHQRLTGVLHGERVFIQDDAALAAKAQHPQQPQQGRSCPQRP